MQQYPLSAKAIGNVATATLSNVLATGVRWSIQQVSVTTNSTNTTKAGIYVNNLLFAATASGNFDAATGPPPLTITAKDTVQILWTGCNNGDQCQAVLYYDAVQ